MIKAIKFVSVPVTDQDRSLKFFTEKLGACAAEGIVARKWRIEARFSRF